MQFLLQREYESGLSAVKNSQSFTSKDLKCNYGNPIKNVCINKSCNLQNAVMCDDQDCQCSTTHELCFKSSLKSIIKTIQSRALSFDKIKDEIEKIFLNAIDKLSLIQQNLLSKYGRLFSHKAYSTYEEQFLESLKLGQCKNITGNLMFQINSHLNKRNQLNKPITDTTKQFERVSALFMNQITIFGMDLEKQLQSIDSFFKSAIINSTQIKNQLINFLPKKIQKTELLYKASEHNFSGSIFHKLCDNVKELVILVKTKHEKIIGGYTSLAFPSTNRIKIVEDPKLQSFLFSLTQGDKLTLKNPDFALMNYSVSSDYVISFGHDLKITDNANSNSKSLTSLSFSYQNGKYQHNQFGWKKFTGSETPFFAIEEWEVWKITPV